MNNNNLHYRLISNHKTLSHHFLAYRVSWVFRCSHVPLVFPHHFHRLILSRDYSSFFWLADFSSWLLFTFLIGWISHVITPTILMGWFCHLNTPLTFDWLILSCDYSSHFWLADSVIWLFGWYFGQSYSFIHKVYAMWNENVLINDYCWLNVARAIGWGVCTWPAFLRANIGQNNWTFRKKMLSHAQLTSWRHLW